MPTLKNLTCNIRWSGNNEALPEYATTYRDGHVDTFVAIPESSNPTPFFIQLTSDGYIAPGLAMFVYMDGIYQCNRNIQNLVVPDENSAKKATEIDFKVRQKEEFRPDGSLWGQQWQFNKLRAECNQTTTLPDTHDGAYLGTIEVLILRCDKDNKLPDPKSIFRLPPNFFDSSSRTLAAFSSQHKWIHSPASNGTQSNDQVDLTKSTDKTGYAPPTQAVGDDNGSVKSDHSRAWHQQYMNFVHGDSIGSRGQTNACSGHKDFSSSEDSNHASSEDFVFNEETVRKLLATPKPHWSEWRSQSYNEPRNRTPAECTKWSISSEAAQNLLATHQVSMSKPMPYMHKLTKPKYMDTMDRPYGLFTFMYRGIETLERMFGVRLRNDEEKIKDSIESLSREELIKIICEMKSQKISDSSTPNLHESDDLGTSEWKQPEQPSANVSWQQGSNAEWEFSNNEGESHHTEQWGAGRENGDFDRATGNTADNRRPRNNETHAQGVENAGSWSKDWNQNTDNNTAGEFDAVDTGWGEGHDGKKIQGSNRPDTAHPGSDCRNIDPDDYASRCDHKPEGHSTSYCEESNQHHQGVNWSSATPQAPYRGGSLSDRIEAELKLGFPSQRKLGKDGQPQTSSWQSTLNDNIPGSSGDTSAKIETQTYHDKPYRFGSGDSAHLRWVLQPGRVVENIFGKDHKPFQYIPEPEITQDLNQVNLYSENAPPNTWGKATETNGRQRQMPGSWVSTSSGSPKFSTKKPQIQGNAQIRSTSSKRRRSDEQISSAIGERSTFLSTTGRYLPSKPSPITQEFKCHEDIISDQHQHNDVASGYVDDSFWKNRTIESMLSRNGDDHIATTDGSQHCLPYLGRSRTGSNDNKPATQNKVERPNSGDILNNGSVRSARGSTGNFRLPTEAESKSGRRTSVLENRNGSFGSVLNVNDTPGAPALEIDAVW